MVFVLDQHDSTSVAQKTNLIPDPLSLTDSSSSYRCTIAIRARFQKPSSIT